MAYYIVETVEQLESLPEVSTCYIELITLSEHNHPALTSPCVLYYNDLQKGYILPINHSEGFSLGLEQIQQHLRNIEKVYLVNKKRHLYYLDLPKSIDLVFNILGATGEYKDEKYYTGVHLDFYERFKYREDENSLIPIPKHYERCENLFNSIRQYIGQETNPEWYDKFVEAYKWVEEQGIGVDQKVFDKYFEPAWKSRSIKEGITYTEYNLYNTTSRPTNAFNGINYLALNKENGSRAAFIPINDAFIEFDFDGYHLRLLAKILKIDLPSVTSIHSYLGKQYYGKEELTEEEYQRAKKVTFRQLYNGVEPEYRHIPFLQRVDIFAQKLWRQYESTGHLLLPNSRKIKVESPTPQKLLNYYTQCIETVSNVEKLLALKKLLVNKRSKVVLVVYDSLLIDFSAEDGKGFLKELKDLLESDGHKVKGKKGLDYNF